MATISQEELRSNVDKVLRRAEAGEQMTVTVAGRPVAVLGPVPRRREWVPQEDLAGIWSTPAPKTAARDLEELPGGFADPFD